MNANDPAPMAVPPLRKARARVGGRLHPVLMDAENTQLAVAMRDDVEGLRLDAIINATSRAATSPAEQRAASADSAPHAGPAAHTPEPWRVVPRPAADGSGIIESSDRVNIVFVPAKTQRDGLPTARPNMERIVACVNALAGLDPSAIPALVEAADEALNALIGCAVPAGGCDDRKHLLDAQASLCAALAAAKGGAR